MKLRSKKPALTSRPAYDIAIGLLARREHSTAELARKLRQKGCDSASTDEALDRLQTEGLLSDQRFVEAYVHMRKQRGYGPLRILAELKEKGVASDLAANQIYHPEHDWSRVLQQVYEQKFTGLPIEDYQDRAKRIAKLQARGFALETVFGMLKVHDDQR